jgi:hypothetical protein
LGVRNPQDAAWVDAQCTPQSIATFEERIRLTGEIQRVRDITYVFPTECHPNLKVSHERAKARGWKIRTVQDSAHELMIDHPEELAGFLLGLESLADSRRSN